GQIVAEQISLALCDQIAPPPSYDSLFGRTLPDTILAEEAKACLPSHSAQGVSCTVPNGVAPAPSSSHVQIKADPEENESVSMTLLCPEIQSCGSSSVGTDPEVEESKPVTPKSLLSLDSLDKKTLGSPPLASNLLFHTSAGLARPTSRPGLFYGSYGLPPDRNPYQIYGPLLQINRHNFSARSASTLSCARTTLLSLPSPLRLTTTTALALGPRTCSGSFNGGYGASGFQLNPNLSSNHNGPSGNSPLEDSGGVWSGQGPGHDSIDLENLQSQSDRRAHLESLAQEMGYRLVPAAYYDWIRALVARVFDLAPQPPVPLQTFSPPTPNTSAQFANYGPNLNSAVALPLALDDLLGPTFGGYDGLQHLIPFNYPPTVSHPQFVPRDAAPPTHPSPAIPYDISWGWLDNLEKTSQGLTGRAESESQPSVVTQLPESMSLPATESRAPYSIENTVDQVPDGRTLNRIEPDGNSVRQPPDATTLAACMAGPSSSAQDTPTDTSLEPRTTKQSAAATPQTGPIRTVKWAVCPFENCGKRFRRRYLLEAHLESYHKGKNAFPCVFPGCNKSYSLKTNMQRHYKSVHE
ncbi:Transcription factor IIIA, partial [Ceratobasidium sp. 394]